MDFKGDTLDVNVVDEGEGDVIVLLHGWLASAEVYRSIINMLRGNFRVIAPDFPGFGKSTEPSFAYDVEDYCDFVAELLRRLNVSKASFIGHSHGGRVIIALASRENLPFEISKIVLIDSAGIVSKKSLSKRAKIRTFKILKKIVSVKPVRKAFPEALPHLRKVFGSADYASSSETLQKSMVKLVNTDLSSRLPLIKQPTLLIWGENDDATPLSHAKIMEKEIPDAGLVVIKGAGHFSFTSDIPLTERVLRSFFNF